MASSSATSYYRSDEHVRIVDDTVRDSSSSVDRHSETVAGQLGQKRPVRLQPSENKDADFISMPLSRERFEVLKNWEGVVTAVERKSFFAMARLVDSELDRAEDELEIDFDNVLSSERSLVQEGAVFYLTVGKRYPEGGRPEKVTKLIFRRMPRWSTGDIERAKATAEDLLQRLNPRNPISKQSNSEGPNYKTEQEK
jgi:hypothetical protein